MDQRAQHRKGHEGIEDTVPPHPFVGSSRLYVVLGSEELSSSSTIRLNVRPQSF